jgi:hypothetical protein
MGFFTDDAVLELPRGPYPWGRRFQGREEWLLTGTTTQGDRIEVRGCDLFEFQGDKIAHKDSYWKLVEH